MKPTVSIITASVLAAVAGTAHADAIIGPELTEMLPTALTPTKVIVTTHDQSQLNDVMANLGQPYLAMKTLPMAGATLTKAQINALAKDERVKSIYYDAPLKYYNYNSGEITGGHYVHDVENVTGRGATIAVLDSGVDATHPDLQLGSKVVQNVKIVGDLDLAGGLNLFLEGVPNSDTSSGHGSHVAGTVAGTGAASSDDARRANYHDGIAPDAKLVGLGAGDAISILYAIAGFDYAIGNKDKYGIDVITNSWGTSGGAEFDPNSPTNQASYEAYKQGIIVTFAAGNDGPGDNTLNPYGVAPWTINVAAGTEDRGLANFSSRGVAGDEFKAPDVTAPGSNIISTKALNTVLPLLGPVLDPEYPEYDVYYAGMSGTSMATPFVAGVAGLLLEVNPDLSPDQIEEIIRDTADPMEGFEFHQVGGGYINVKAAVEKARVTEGKRAEFMGGATKWSSQGNWKVVSENDSMIDYVSRWSTKSDADSTDGSYQQSRRNNAEVMFNFIGDSIQILYTANSKGGHGEVFLNGQSKGVIDFYAPQSTAKAFVLRDLNTSQVHSLSIKNVEGTINFDGLKMDGQLVDNGTSITVDQQVIEGNIGPSAENIQFNDHVISVGADAVAIDAVLSWGGVADLDFQMLDAEGNVVASSASLDNPEVISFRPEQAGDYTLRVNGYISVSTDYTIDVEVSNLIQ